MADLIPWSNLLAPYNSPNQMAEQNANIQQSQAQTGLIGAQTGLVGQQTQAADIANQGAMTQLQMLRQALNGGMPDASAVPGATTATPGMTGNAPAPTSDGGTSSGHPSNYPSVDDMQAYTQQKLGPLPVQFTTSEQQWLQRMRSTGNPLLSAQAQAFEDGRIKATQQENASRQYQANQGYAVASSVATAPEGAAFATMMRYAPDLARGLAAKFPDAFTTDSMGNPVAKPQGDADAAAYARSGAANIYQYTGREHTMENGVLIDKASGKPVPGQNQVLTGLDAAGKQKAFDQANTMIDIGAPEKVPLYKASGFSSPAAYVFAADKAARSSAATGTSSSAQGNAPASSQGIPSTGGNLVSAATGPRPTSAAGSGASGATNAPVSSAPSTATSSSPWSAIPKIPQALTDPSSITTPILKAQSDALVKKDSDMRDSIQEAADNGNNRLQLNADAARALPNAATGPTADWLNDGRKLLVQMGWASPETAQKVVDTTTLNKDLTQNALQSGKLMFGSKYTESEVGLMLTKANASGEMTPQAIHELLLQDNLRSQYAVQKQQDYEKYTSQGGDPRKFDGWYNTNFSLQKFATQNRSAVDAQLKAQEAGPTRPGQQSSGQGAPAAAIQALRQNPALGPQFKAKYGYLPQ